MIKVGLRRDLVPGEIELALEVLLGLTEAELRLRDAIPRRERRLAELRAHIADLERELDPQRNSLFPGAQAWLRELADFERAALLGLLYGWGVANGDRRRVYS